MDLVFFCLPAAGAIFSWKSYFFPANGLRARKFQTILWCTLMTLCAGAEYVVLRFWSAGDVRSDPGEVLFYFFFSLIWIYVAQTSFAAVGISLRDDVGERGNSAAAFVCAGLTVAVTSCVAGSNIGNGPGFEVVLFCAALSTVTIFILWMLLAVLAGAAETITIERDIGAGIRVGGWLIGSGLVLGASSAGDWVSLNATLRDFLRFTWPLFVFLIPFVFVEKTMSRRALAKRLRVVPSAVLATGMVAVGVWYSVWIVKH